MQHDFWRIISEYMMNYGAKMCQRGPARAPHVLVACRPRACRVAMWAHGSFSLDVLWLQNHIFPRINHKNM